MVNLRVLLAMALGALVAALGALFLGEYEFDELLTVAAGPLLGLVVAEIVVSVGRHRSPAMAVVVASWSVTAVLLAGYLDTNDNEPIKAGAYLSAALAGLAAAARTVDWRRYRTRSSSNSQPSGATMATRRPPAES